jgi:hypothetical protein
MKHINLNEQAEAIKQFFLSLPEDPEGALVELNGQAVTRLVPIRDDTQVEASGTWTTAMNVRRCFLIDREIEDTLTPEEARELERLQKSMSKHLHRVAPLPIDGTRKLYDDLLAKVQAARGE